MFTKPANTAGTSYYVGDYMKGPYGVESRDWSGLKGMSQSASLAQMGKTNITLEELTKAYTYLWKHAPSEDLDTIWDALFLDANNIIDYPADPQREGVGVGPGEAPKKKGEI